MKGERKDHYSVEWTMNVLRCDYVKAYVLVKEQQTMINGLPKGKERDFLQRDLDQWKSDFNGQLDFKRGLMEIMGIKDDPITFMYSKKELAEMHERLRATSFSGAEESDMPSASG
jgi:hypothetical protein